MPKREHIIASVMTLLLILLAIYMFYTPPQHEEKPNNPIAVVNTNMGNFSIELYENLVPDLTNHFIRYATSDIYEDMVFHKTYHPLHMDSNGKMVPTEASMLMAGLYDKTLYSCSSMETNQTMHDCYRKAVLDAPYMMEYGRTDVDGIDLIHEDLMVSWYKNNTFSSTKIYSQFYICNGDDLTGYGPRSARLDAHDPVFGKVISGEDVVRKMGNIPTHSEYNESGDANLTLMPDDPVIIKEIKIVRNEDGMKASYLLLPSQNLMKESTMESTKLCLYVMSTFATRSSSMT